MPDNKVAGSARTMSHCLVWGRRLAAAAVLAGFFALFLGFGGIAAKLLVRLAKWQFAPALLAGNLAVALAAAIVTALFGRVYCSVCCPLGILQDVAFALRRHAAQPRGRNALQAVVRYTVLAAFLAVGFAGLGFSWIEPYGVFGRGLSAATLEIPLWAKASQIALVAAIFLLSLWKGRIWCNWICPVGTFLGGLARKAPFVPKIDASRCIGCRKCEKGCRAGAITISGKGEGGEIDRTKCIQCRDCTVACPAAAISSSGSRSASRREVERPGELRREASGDDVTRREFIAGSAALGIAFGADAAEEKIHDGGFAPVTDPGIDARNASLKPAGAGSIGNFKTRCVACQLCVRACPNHVLRPSLRAADFMQPEMAFDRGYCTVDCNKCGQVCPAGAIAPIPAFMKRNIHIGAAEWHHDRCLAATEGVNCNACARHCPVGAIQRVPGPDGTLIPVVDEDKCIGCGACEHVCPARPLPAMTVRAFDRHREVWPSPADAALREAVRLVQQDGYACVVVKDGAIAMREKGGGVAPLLGILAAAPDAMKNATVVDKVIGRAAAAICVVGGASKVVGITMSDEARDFLAANGVACEAFMRVPRILDRDKADSCPLEKSCAGLDDPQAMLAAIRAFIGR